MPPLSWPDVLVGVFFAVVVLAAAYQFGGLYVFARWQRLGTQFHDLAYLISRAVQDMAKEPGRAALVIEIPKLTGRLEGVDIWLFAESRADAITDKARELKSQVEMDEIHW